MSEYYSDYEAETVKKRDAQWGEWVNQAVKANFTPEEQAQFFNRGYSNVAEAVAAMRDIASGGSRSRAEHLLNQAFNQGRISRETYAQQYERITGRKP
jgi:hypothetical protein